jgi:Tol biopolymer transport system component
MESTCARALLSALLAASAAGQVTLRASVGSSGAQGDSSSFYSSISADGRILAFESSSTNLVPGDTNGWQDIFVRDRQSGVTERVSVHSSGAEGNDQSYAPSISADGRTVAFESYASTLVDGDTNGVPDIFVRDRLLGTTERVSLASSGGQADDSSFDPSISADGRYVAFESLATNLVSGDTNGCFDVFVRDRLFGTTERVSVDSSGAQGDGNSGYDSFLSISADGRYVAFQSVATNLVGGDTNGVPDVFVRDRLFGTTERVSVDSSGTQGDDNSGVPSISADGRTVAFYSAATNLVGGDTNGSWDVFVRDRQLGTTERVSVSSSGAQGNGFSFTPSISADGRTVAFGSIATDLVGGDTNGTYDVFARDRAGGTTERVSLASSGVQGDADSHPASISADGRCVTFFSAAASLVPGDTNSSYDVLIRDRTGGTSFTSLCDPGVGGVIACPCSNPPSGPGRGCDNSSATGGAVLSASGGAFLSSDSLVLTTSGERPTALSIVAQGNALVPSGSVYGQGVRCAGGSLLRLYNKVASGGSITAPSFGAGDPSVSARSAAKGDPIRAGGSRWYFVYYRDPTVLGGCPGASRFNTTQTGVVTWSP